MHWTNGALKYETKKNQKINDNFTEDIYSHLNISKKYYFH